MTHVACGVVRRAFSLFNFTGHRDPDRPSDLATTCGCDLTRAKIGPTRTDGLHGSQSPISLSRSLVSVLYSDSVESCFSGHTLPVDARRSGL